MNLTPAFVFCEAVPFLPFDALIALTLVNRACRSISSAERQKRESFNPHAEAIRRILLESSGREPDAVALQAPVLLRLLLSHALELSTNDTLTCSSSGSHSPQRRASWQLPGMPEEMDPLAEISLEWGNAFPLSSEIRHIQTSEVHIHLPSAVDEAETPLTPPNSQYQPTDVHSCFTTTSNTHKPQLLPVAWRLKQTHRVTSGENFGKIFVGAADVLVESNGTVTRSSSNMIVISFGHLALMQTGGAAGFSCSLLLERTNGGIFALRDIYWHYNIGADNVLVLRRRVAPQRQSQQAGHNAAAAPPINNYYTESGDEALISSHPVMSGHWYTWANASIAAAQGNTAPNERVSLEQIRPFTLQVGMDSDHTTAGGDLLDNASFSSAFTFETHLATPKQRLGWLMQLIDMDRSDTEFLGLVKCSYFDRISQQVESAARDGSVFTIDEEFAQMTTPKGVWTYPTGFGTRTVVDAAKSWELRRDRLIHSLRRNVGRGAREAFSLGWLPVGILSSLSLQ